MKEHTNSKNKYHEDQDTGIFFFGNSLSAESRHSNGYKLHPSSSGHLSILTRSRIYTVSVTLEIVTQEVKLSTRGFYYTIWMVLLANVYWHSVAQPVTVTSQPIIFCTNFMTLIPSVRFVELREVSMEHFRRVWHVGRERLTFWTPCSATFGDLHMLFFLLRPFSQPAVIFSTFHFKYVEVLFRFAPKYRITSKEPTYFKIMNSPIDTVMTTRRNRISPCRLMFTWLTGTILYMREKRKLMQWKQTILFRLYYENTTFLFFPESLSCSWYLV